MFRLLKRCLKREPRESAIEERTRVRELAVREHERSPVELRNATEHSIGRQNAGLPPLIFKSSNDAFDYACRRFDNKIEEKKVMVAVIVDSRKEFGTSNWFAKNQDGTFVAALRVASNKAGFLTIATVPSSKADLKPGDLVYWVPMGYSREVARGLRTKEAGWVGLVVAKLSTELTTNNSFKIVEEYS
jgi:hypothetical protein